MVHLVLLLHVVALIVAAQSTASLGFVRGVVTGEHGGSVGRPYTGAGTRLSNIVQMPRRGLSATTSAYGRSSLAAWW